MKRIASMCAVLVLLICMVFSISAKGNPAAAPATIILKLPAGTYTGLMFTAAGVPDASHAIAVIKTRTDQFLINLAPGASVSVPFVDGWEVEDGEVTIRLTPGGGIGAVPSAWAITAEGPVALK